MLLDGPGTDTDIDTAKTNRRGKVIFTGSFDDGRAGQSLDLLVTHEGGSKAKTSGSDVFTISVTG